MLSAATFVAATSHIGSECGVIANLFDSDAALSPERRRWRDAIRSTQQPTSCAASPVCTCNASHGQVTSLVHATATCVLEAAVRGCALVAAPTMDGFQPLSICSGDGRVPIHLRLHQSPTQLESRCLDVQRRFGLRGTLACFGDAVAYAMTGHAMAAEIHRLAAKMQLGACANRTRLDETIAVHVRHGDKIGTIHTDAEVQAHAALVKHHAKCLG